MSDVCLFIRAGTRGDKAQSPETIKRFAIGTLGQKHKQTKEMTQGEEDDEIYAV